MVLMDATVAAMIKDTWVAEATCCKTWYVLLPYPVRKCGECGERPVVDWHVIDDEH